MKFFAAIVVAFALSGCQSAVKPAAPRLPTEAAQRQLAEAYLAATRAHDPAQVRKLLHPAVLACINDSNRDLFDFELTNKAQDVPSSPYKIWITPVSASYPPPTLPADKFTYPVQPSHQFQIDFDLGGDNHTLTMLGAIAEQNGDWYLVLECPNAAGVKFFHDMMAQSQEQQVDVSPLVAKLSDSAKSKIKDLVKAGRRIDAIKFCQSELKTDLTTAVQVVAALDKDEK